MNKAGSKHLNLSDRKLIEQFLNQNLSCNEIARQLDKDPRTISREVKKRRDRRKNGKFNSNIPVSPATKYKAPPECKTLNRFPFVCNGCDHHHKVGCRNQYKYYYVADLAQENYKILLSDSRIGLDVSLEDKIRFDTILQDGINKGQSIHHICESHKGELPYSERSAYRLIDRQQTTVQAIDLRRKVKLKPRKHYVYKDDNKAIREGRRYIDFLTYMASHPSITVTELDTVLATTEGHHKCLLTIHSTATHFMLIYVLEDKSKACVSAKLKELQQSFGADGFHRFFDVTLTDRGTEFCDPYSFEVDESTGERLANMFFCNSYSSYQKGSIEENHELIRYILPKGILFDDLTQDKADLMASHINSYVRKSIGGCPYDMALAFFGQEFLEKTKIRKIPPDLVTLSYSLIR